MLLCLVQQLKAKLWLGVGGLHHDHEGSLLAPVTVLDMRDPSVQLEASEACTSGGGVRDWHFAGSRALQCKKVGRGRVS